MCPPTHPFQPHPATEWRHRRQAAERALLRLGHQLVEARKGDPRRLQLMPGRRNLPHRLQRPRRQEIGGDQAADRERTGDDLVHPDQHDGEQSQEMQAGRGADGEVGKLAGAEVAGRRALDPRLPALLDLGLEAECLDGRGVGHGLGQRRALGGERLEELVGQAPQRAMGQDGHRHQQRDRQHRDQAQQRIDGEQRQQEQHGEDEIDRERRQLAGDEAAQHVELAQTLGDHARAACARSVGREAAPDDAATCGAHQRVETRRRPGPTASRAPTAIRSRARRQRADQPTRS